MSESVAKLPAELVAMSECPHEECSALMSAIDEGRRTKRSRGGGVEDWNVDDSNCASEARRTVFSAVDKIAVSHDLNDGIGDKVENVVKSERNE